MQLLTIDISSPPQCLLTFLDNLFTHCSHCNSLDSACLLLAQLPAFFNFIMCALNRQLSVLCKLVTLYTKITIFTLSINKNRNISFIAMFYFQCWKCCYGANEILPFDTDIALYELLLYVPFDNFVYHLTLFKYITNIHNFIT